MKNSSRRINRRLGHKQARAAERTVLEGGHPRLVHGEHWDGGIEQPHLPDAPARYKKLSKRKPHKKERCTQNPHGHTHEWMKEERDIKVPKYSYFTYRVIGFEMVREQIKLCAWCDREMYRRLHTSHHWRTGVRKQKWSKWKTRTGE